MVRLLGLAMLIPVRTLLWAVVDHKLLAEIFTAELLHVPDED
jgi:hypothetical protein